MAERVAIVVIVSMVGAFSVAAYVDNWWALIGLCAVFTFSIFVALMGE